MKCKITLSIALALSIVLVSLTISDSTSKAQPQQRYRFRTGVLTPAVGQTLRVTVAAGDVNGDALVRFMQTQFGAPVCGGTPPVCRHIAVSQDGTATLMLGADAISFDVPGNGNGVSVVVEGSSRNALVTVMIIDNATGFVAITDHSEFLS